jgi:hypothetical protein
MEYGATYSKERLTGRGYFAASGQTAPITYIDLGNVTMFECDFSIKRKEHYANRRGIQTIDRYDAYSSIGSWKITLDEYVTATMALLWSGTPNAAVTQTAATTGSGSFMFTYAATMKGTSLDIGKYGLANCAITGKVEGVDFIVDRAGGKLYIPFGTSLVAGPITLTFDCPALTYDSATALNTLNRPGTFQLQGEDDSQSGKINPANGVDIDAVSPLRYLWNFTCILSCDK